MRETNTATTAGRPIRRRNRCLTDHAVPSTVDAAGVPYGVPISPVYAAGRLYFHCLSLPGGRKTDNMLANPRVSACFIRKQETLPESFSVDDESAIVAGHAQAVTDPSQWHAALAAPCRRHAPSRTPEDVQAEIRTHAKATAVWRIDSESVTGKSRAGSKNKSSRLG